MIFSLSYNVSHIFLLATDRCSFTVISKAVDSG